MSSWPASRFSSWCYDESNRLILLKVPEQIRIHSVIEKPRPPPVLSTLDKASQPPRTAPTLPSLPAEIHFTILHHLAPVDRVCLALTCRRLCASVLSSPRLTADTWMRFTNIADISNRYWNPNSTYCAFAPLHYQLCQRLAHGWVDKTKWRYCWKCHKILPRSEEWWWKTRDRNGHKRIEGRRNPRWSAKIGVCQDEWLNWSRKKKLKWIVIVWCKASWEDSSIVGCEWCREKLMAEDAERIRYELHEPKTPVVSWNKELDVMNFVGTRHPVECPSCLEQELTFSWRQYRRVPMTKKIFWSVCGCLRDWSIGLFWCIMSPVVALLIMFGEIAMALLKLVAFCREAGP